MKTTYFGLEIINDKFVRQSDIEQLPFFEFWQASSLGSTIGVDPDTGNFLIYLHDWERFCRSFIKTGKHRFSKRD